MPHRIVRRDGLLVDGPLERLREQNDPASGVAFLVR